MNIVLVNSLVHKQTVPIETDEESMANPDSRDPDTNEPLTPVVRVKKIAAQNDPENANSFTTYETENQVTLEAEVLPADWAQGAVVSWTLDDSPADNFITPLPSNLPAAGVRSGFSVDVKNPADGVPAPFRYRIVANAAKAGKDVSSKPRAIKQDEIDKCRQEYVDFGIELLKVPRSSFTVGVGMDPEMVKYKDCLAYIYPSRAQDAKDLVAKFDGVKITGGYRSPRRNWDIYKDRDPDARAVKTSWHMFGNAVDLDFLPHEAANWKKLWDWEGTTIPKILEAPGGVPMIKKDSNGLLTIFKPYKEPSLYGSGYCLHLGE